MLFASTLCSILLLLAALLFTVSLVHWHIDREFYSHIPIAYLIENSFFKFTIVKTSSTGTQIIEYPATLNNISHWSIYLFYSQLMVITLLILAAVREFTTVIRSVMQIQTFVSSNIASFKKIGFSLFMAFIIAGFQIVSYKESMLYGIYLHPSLLVISLLSYTLSEIFKEGNALLEENKGVI